MSGCDAVIRKKSKFHMFEDGEYVTYISGPSGSGNYRFRNDSGYKQHVPPDEFEWLNEEDTTMAKKKASGTSERNPKNFRNGDVIRVSSYEPGMTATSSFVYVKFGENYYNLSQGGQMKACRYLPPGTKEIITNLSGMGKFFLMSEEELEEASKEQGDWDMNPPNPFGPSGGSTKSFENGYAIKGSVTDFEYIMKLAEDWAKKPSPDDDVTFQTDTTEEKG